MIMRKQFRIEMKKLHELILNMDMTIKNNIDMMITAIKFKDLSLAEKVIKNDDAVDKLEMEIEEFCIDILMRQQPVAKDLRGVTAVLKMITDLERISDYCGSVCEHFLKIQDSYNEECIEKIIQLSKNAKDMFNGMVHGYLEQDSSKIADVNNKDYISDQIYSDLENYIVKNINAMKPKSAIKTLLMGRALERMADHITNVCEYINFKITGNFKLQD